MGQQHGRHAFAASSGDRMLAQAQRAVIPQPQGNALGLRVGLVRGLQGSRANHETCADIIAPRRGACIYGGGRRTPGPLGWAEGSRAVGPNDAHARPFAPKRPRATVIHARAG